MYIKDFFKYIENEKRYSSHTLLSYKTDLNQFVAFCKNNIKDFNLLTVDNKIIRRWIIFLLERRISSRTVNRKITTLKSFYKFLYQRQLIDTLPTQKVVLPKMSKKLPHFIGQKAMDRLFDQFDFPKNFEGERDKLVLLIFYCTGMRLSELVQLKIQDIDFHYKQLKVLGKRNKERLIPFGNELSEHLKAYIQIRATVSKGDNYYLVITQKGEPSYSKLIYRIVNKYLSQITTLEKRSPHVLRHTFATQMLNNGADINAIKELLGHANLSATQVYTHTSFDKLKTIYNQAHPRA